MIAIGNLSYITQTAINKHNIESIRMDKTTEIRSKTN